MTTHLTKENHGWIAKELFQIISDAPYTNAADAERVIKNLEAECAKYEQTDEERNCLRRAFDSTRDCLKAQGQNGERKRNIAQENAWKVRGIRDFEENLRRFND